MNSCHFFPSMPHGKIKSIFCNQGTFLLCHYLKTFNNSRNILKEKCTSNNMSPGKRTNQLAFFCQILPQFDIIWDLQSNLCIRAMYIAVTLYITVAEQLPKIFSCLIFSAKLTCIHSSHPVYNGHLAISLRVTVVHRFDCITKQTGAKMKCTD